jgi:DNA-directed RNA polymerase specialized sigma24 family protein
VTHMASGRQIGGQGKPLASQPLVPAPRCRPRRTYGRHDRDFGEFADTQSSRLLGFAYALTGNPHDAWDLVQETLVRVGVRWRRLRDEDPSAYARTVLVRLNIDRLRCLRREFPVIQVRDSGAPVVEVGHVDQWLLDAQRSVQPR